MHRHSSLHGGSLCACMNCSGLFLVLPVQGVAEASGRAAVSLRPQRAQVRPGAHHRGDPAVPGRGCLQHGGFALGECSTMVFPWCVFSNDLPLVSVLQWLALGECSAMTYRWWVFSSDLHLVSVQQWLALGECLTVTCPWWVFSSDLSLVSVQQ